MEAQACKKWRGLTVAFQGLKVPSTKVDESTGSERECGWPNIEFSH